MDERLMERFGVSAARVRAAAALRRLGHDFVGSVADDEWFDEVTAVVEGLLSGVGGGERRSRSLTGVLDVAAGSWPGELPVDGDALSHFPDCVVSGPANPMGLAIDVRYDGGDAVAKVVLGAAFEGAPGRAHGGVVAAVFDDLMGYQLSILKVPAFTGRLSVVYRAPTPVGEALMFRARLEGRDDRKLQISATAHTLEGALVAEATSTFVIVSLERMLTGPSGGAA